MFWRLGRKSTVRSNSSATGSLQNDSLTRWFNFDHRMPSVRVAGALIKSISFCAILAALVLCLFIHLLTIIGSGSPCFSHVEVDEPEPLSLSTSSQEHSWLALCNQTTTGTKARHSGWRRRVSSVWG